MSQERDHKQLEDDVRAAVRSFAASLTSASQGVADMSSLVRVTSRTSLLNLAHWERLIRDEFDVAWRAAERSESSGWRTLLPSSRSKGRAEPARFLTWIDLSHWDGYVRERTLRSLSGSAPNSFFFALAARRLNDWVPQVRAAAREVVPRLAESSDPELVAEALCALLPTWTSWGRLEESDKDVISKLVSLPELATPLTRRLLVSSTGPMSAVLAQIQRWTVLDKHLEVIASEAVQPAVRARAYRSMLLGKAVWVEGRSWRWTDIRYLQGRLNNVLGERRLSHVPVLLDTLNAAALDRSSIVRRVAAEALVREIDNLGEAVMPLARRIADDPSPSVAERGAFVLRQLAIRAAETAARSSVKPAAAP
ncbi:hypothetical protein [Eleftheria terrae]|uniref:hypothetical protein n=1 Tax=Eleftheria terrae TaxID=1597781 RepID=UPI00263B4114|nr:hypothetical protein [Eleftheria terrae]WKB56022.1 hypothetical protein N7L95_28560 [Eleftheria terrae]